MILEEALKHSMYARRPLYMHPDRNGRPVVGKWLVCYGPDYFRDSKSTSFTVCYPDMRRAFFCTSVT